MRDIINRELNIGDLIWVIYGGSSIFIMPAIIVGNTPTLLKYLDMYDYERKYMEGKDIKPDKKAPHNVFKADFQQLRDYGYNAPTIEAMIRTHLNFQETGKFELIPAE